MILETLKNKLFWTPSFEVRSFSSGHSSFGKYSNVWVNFCVYLVHPEVLAAISMLSPIMFSIYFVCSHSPLLNPFAVWLSGMSCVVHFPWSAGLHFYRAYGNQDRIRVILYKADVLFQHVGALCTKYAALNQFSMMDVAFHGGSICHLLVSDPIRDPKCKKTIGVLSGAGLISCSFFLFERNTHCFYTAFSVGGLCFLVHHYNLLGAYSSFWFHFFTGIPQYCILAGLNMNVSP